jgi:hypothetical protein
LIKFSRLDEKIIAAKEDSNYLNKRAKSAMKAVAKLIEQRRANAMRVVRYIEDLQTPPPPEE